jgi:hypothetical protein
MTRERNDKGGAKLSTRASAAGATVLVFMAGCSMTPSFDGPVGPSDVRPSVDAVVKNIQCEIHGVQTEKTNPNDPELQWVQRFQQSPYVVYVNLTLDVSDTQGLTPGFSVLNTLGNFTGLANLNYTGTQHRNINPTFALDLSKPTPGLDAMCERNRETTGGISGNLGLREIIIAGVSKSTSPDFGYGLVGTATGDANKLAAPPTFVSTIDFTITKGISGGPTWSFKTLKVTGGSGPVSASETNKDTLVISFARSTTTPAEPAATVELRNRFFLAHPGAKLPPELEAPLAAGPSPDAAAAAAQNAATTSILQNLLNRLPLAP